jgi:hypothetical protein
MDLVIAGNETLAAVAMPHSKRVEIVPTPVDTQRLSPPGGRRLEAADARLDRSP